MAGLVGLALILANFSLVGLASMLQFDGPQLGQEPWPTLDWLALPRFLTTSACSCQMSDHWSFRLMVANKRATKNPFTTLAILACLACCNLIGQGCLDCGINICYNFGYQLTQQSTVKGYRGVSVETWKLQGAPVRATANRWLPRKRICGHLRMTGWMSML